MPTIRRLCQHAATARLAALCIASGALGVTSCSSGDEATSDLLPDGKYPLAIAAASVADTRADGKDTFAEGDEIGVTMTQGDYSESGTYTLASDGTFTSKDTDENTDNTIYWQSATDEATIAAWYPATEQTAIDISNQADGFASYDFLYTTEPCKATFGETVSLTFTHQMAKITCTLAAGDGVSSEALSAATVEIYGHTTPTFTCGAVSTAGSTLDWITTTATDHQALIPPTTLSSGTPLFRITIDGTPFIYTLPSATTFSAGNAYAYVITVKPDLIEVNAAAATWGEGAVTEVTSY